MRPLHEIARDIRQHWPNVWFGAVPYLQALSRADKITDIYIVGNHYSTVQGFLGNAATWRGPEARRIKSELKAMLKGGK